MIILLLFYPALYISKNFIAPVYECISNHDFDLVSVKNNFLFFIQIIQGKDCQKMEILNLSMCNFRTIRLT